MQNRILVIGYKNKDVTDKIVSLLTKEGFNVATATGTREALIKLDEFEPELIILGNAPTGDIYKICQQMREIADSLIILLGTVEGGEAWAQSVNSGADFYLVRPFSNLELVARVKSMLRRSELSAKCAG